MTVITALNSSQNSSATSSHQDSSEDVIVLNVQKYVKELLKSRIFLGRYIERRFVNQRIGYRDIVLISAAETELARDLLEAAEKLRSVLQSSHWIGITNPEILGLHVSPSLCLWTEIENQPLGAFWFQIKTIKFRDHEVLIALKSIRHITDAFIELEPILTGPVKKTFKSKDVSEKDMSPKDDTITDIKEVLKSVVSIRNVKEFFTFVFALIIAVFAGSTTFVSFLGNFILALLRELSILMKNSTPMFIAIIDFLSKVVGGFYILIAMIFRPSSPAPRDKRSISYYDKVSHHDPRNFD